MGISIENWLFGSNSSPQLPLKFKSQFCLFSVKTLQDMRLDPLDNQSYLLRAWNRPLPTPHGHKFNRTVLPDVRPITCSIGIHENIKQLFLLLFFGLALPIWNREQFLAVFSFLSCLYLLKQNTSTKTKKQNKKRKIVIEKLGCLGGNFKAALTEFRIDWCLVCVRRLFHGLAPR